MLSVDVVINVLFNKYPEVSNIDIDMDNKKVFVTTTVSGEDILAKLKKTGRECSYVGLKQ